MINNCTSFRCRRTKSVNRLKDVWSTFSFDMTCIGKTCHQKDAKFDKCQKSNSGFLIQTSEKGMSLAVKSSIQQLRTGLSHLLPTHPHQRGSRTMTAQSMFMSTRLYSVGHKWPMQQAATESFTLMGFNATLTLLYHTPVSLCQATTIWDVHTWDVLKLRQISRNWYWSFFVNHTHTHWHRHIHNSAHIAHKKHICAGIRIMQTMVPARWGRKAACSSMEDRW